MKTITLLCGLLSLAACVSKPPASNGSATSGNGTEDCQRANASEPCK